MDEVLLTLDRLRSEFEDLAIRGLSVAGPERAGPLASIAKELQTAGAEHLAGRLEKLASAIHAGDRSASAALLEAQATLRMFERVLTLEAAAAQLGTIVACGKEDQEEDESAAPPPASKAAPPAGPAIAPADAKALPPLLKKLGTAVEDLLFSGLTAASDTTRQTIDLAFREASRMRLLRLGSTLRVATEELARFTRNEAEFSKQRLSFFLNRAWMLARGLARAVAAGDAAELGRLAGVGSSRKVARLEVVTLGAAKKYVPGAFCAFDFRLRAVGDHPGVAAGQPLVWSCVFPVKPGTDIPPEGYLQLPQKQKFKGSVFLEGKRILLENVALSGEGEGTLRLQMTDETKVTPGEPFTEWPSLAAWDAAAAAARLARHEMNPLELEVELQEELVLDAWQLGPSRERARDGQLAYPILFRGVELEGVVSKGIDGAALRKSLEELEKKPTSAPLFALVHYEGCRLVCQPLALLEEEKPKYLTISYDDIDRAALLKALKLT